VTNYQDLFDNESPRKFIAQNGRKHTDQARSNMSKGQLGKVIPAETRAKISASRMGYVHSAEALIKMSTSQIGKIVSKETCAKLKDASKARKDAGIPGPRTGKGYQVMTPQGQMSTTAAAELYNTRNATIRYWVRTRPTEFYYVA